ncbi:MAG: hypothetical protein EBZ36_18085 [Acidobacteria bacterium]|nr:hypothetical protein [Acidobacteriota bacterium]
MGAFKKESSLWWVAKSRACHAEFFFGRKRVREVARLSLGLFFRPDARSRSRAPVARIFFSTPCSLAKSRACHSDFFFDPILAREVTRLSLGFFFRHGARSRSRAPVARIFFSTRCSLAKFAKSRACHADDFLRFRLFCFFGAH